MSLATWSIRNPVPTVLLFVLLTVMGWQALIGLPIQRMPDLELPGVIVSASLPNTPAQTMETEVTRKLEDGLAGLNGLEHIRSTTVDGSATLTLDFAMETDRQEAVNDVRDALGRINSLLPAGMDEPRVSRITTAGGAVLTYAVRSELMDETELSWFVDDTVSKALSGVPGVSKITRQGGQEREIRIELDPEALAGLGLTVAEVSSAIGQAQSLSAGGRATLAGQSQSIRLGGQSESAEVLADRLLSLRGRSIRLGDIATLTDTHTERSQGARLDGQPVVSFQVFRSVGESDVAVADKARERVAQLQTAWPRVIFTEADNSTQRILQQHEASLSALWEGAVLAVVVVFLFLRNIRATLIASLALPLSLLPAFWAMQLMDYSLNGLTLLALTLVVGMLVDDAIVEIENIARHANLGKSPRQAAEDAVQEIGLAVLATTLTLVAVFLPTAFMGGVPGLFFQQFGWTAAVAVLSSLLVARLLTPLMAAKFMRGHTEPAEGPVLSWYLRWLDRCIAHPARTLSGTVLFLAASAWLAATLPMSFIPPADSGKVRVSLTLAPGSEYEDTLAVVQKAEALLAKTPGVASLYATIGAGSSGNFRAAESAGEVRSATLSLSLADGVDSRTLTRAVALKLKELPGVRVGLGGGGSGEMYSFSLAASDPSLLYDTALSLERELRSLPGIGSVTSSAALAQPELRVIPRQAQAANAGVAPADLARTLRLATTGDFQAALPSVNLPDRQIPLRTTLPEAYRRDSTLLAEVPVPGINGPLPLRQVADLVRGDSQASIERTDRQRTVTFNVELAGRPMGDVAAEAAQLPTLQTLPQGVEILASGDAERMRELLSGFGFAMLMGLFCIYAILAVLFHAYLQPVTILFAVPLSFGGAFAALHLGGFAFSMPALIGILTLMGIATKNSILLVDYAIEALRSGSPVRVAVTEACQKRARPIVMTTVAMGAGMLPLMLGLGGDASFRAPMAAAVVGGLVTSTLLSLFVVPVGFSLMHKLSSPRP